MPIIESSRLVFSDLSKSSYKYYDIELHDNGDVISRFGAVGATNPQTCNYGNQGKLFYDKKIQSKLKKSYSHAKVINSGGPTNIGENKGSLVDIALSQIRFQNEAIRDLIKRLVNSNVHKITNATSVTYNANSGVLSTPLGVLTAEAINEARILLPFFNDNTKIDAKYKKNIDAYLRLVPRNKSYKMKYEDIFPNSDMVKKELDLLDALENSLAIISKPQVPVVGIVQTPIEKIFDLKLDILHDINERQRIEKKYWETRKSGHSSSNLKIKEIFELQIDCVKNSFDTQGSKLGEIKELWHGTSSSNLISIFRGGLKIIPPSSTKICGAMFSTGLYFASASTKSLNYATGYWSGNREQSFFMFLADVALGKYYVPRSSVSSPPPAGYDSYWAQERVSGVMNDEFIVQKEHQHNLKYLIEFQ